MKQQTQKKIRKRDRLFLIFSLIRIFFKSDPSFASTYNDNSENNNTIVTERIEPSRAAFVTDQKPPEEIDCGPRKDLTLLPKIIKTPSDSETSIKHFFIFLQTFLSKPESDSLIEKLNSDEIQVFARFRELVIKQEFLDEVYEEVLDYLKCCIEFFNKYLEEEIILNDTNLKIIISTIWSERWFIRIIASSSLLGFLVYLLSKLFVVS